MQKSSAYAEAHGYANVDISAVLHWRCVCFDSPYADNVMNLLQISVTLFSLIPCPYFCTPQAVGYKSFHNRAASPAWCAGLRALHSSCLSTSRVLCTYIDGPASHLLQNNLADSSRPFMLTVSSFAVRYLEQALKPVQAAGAAGDFAHLVPVQQQPGLLHLCPAWALRPC